ncbi:MAG: phage holin family protein [Opitutus sp.]
MEGSRALADGLVSSVEDRVALIGMELEEEKRQLIQNLIWIGAAFILSAMTPAMASVLFVYVF